MKHEKLTTCFTAAVLAFFTAWGAVGCLTTAFGLNLEDPYFPVLACGVTAFACAVLYSFRHGDLAVMGLLALGAGYLYHDGTTMDQFVQLVHRLSVIYDRAYGWGILTPAELSADPVFADWPLALTGILIAMTVSQTVVCRTSTWKPVLATLLPLCSCIVVTDTVPGEGWLMMVMAGLLLLILTAYVRRENAAQGIRLALLAALPLVLALAALFLLNPRENYVNHSAILRENILIAVENIPKIMETGMNQMTSGLKKQPPRQVNLAELGARVPFTYPVMEVTAETSGTLYLRQQDYDRYDGLGWRASEGRSEPFCAATGPEETILIRTENLKSSLFLPYHPASETVLENGHAENSTDAREYTLPRCRLPENWRQTAYQNTATSPDSWQQYLSLPETTRQGAAAYLEQLPSGDVSNTEKADMIAALVIGSARYDLDPEKMPAVEPDFALWFLRKGDRGYCVHFATAATVLLRAAGVPARYVTGYILEAAAGETVTVTEESAHAWAEYYEPNLGLWLPLEATPAEENPVQVLPPQTIPEETTAATEPVPETTAPMTEIPTDAATAPEASASGLPQPVPAEPSAPAAKQPFAAAMLLLFLALLILPIQRAVRLKLRRRRWYRGEPNRQALQRWQEAERLARLLKECPTEELIVLAQKAKFSQYDLTEDELARFDGFCRSCLHRLQEKPWYLRLVYRFIYAIY